MIDLGSKTVFLDWLAFWWAGEPVRTTIFGRFEESQVAPKSAAKNGILVLKELVRDTSCFLVQRHHLGCSRVQRHH